MGILIQLKLRNKYRNTAFKKWIELQICDENVKQVIFYDKSTRF